MEADISGFGTQDPTLQGSPSSAGGVGETKSTGTRHNSDESTMEASTDEQIIEMMMASFPTLQQPAQILPDGAIQATSKSGPQVNILAMQTAEMKNNIITNMWKQFTEAVKDGEEKAKKSDIISQEIKDNAHHKRMEVERGQGPLSAADYQTYLTSLTVGERSKEIDPAAQMGALLNQWIVAPIDNSSAVASGNTLDASFIVGALIISSSMVFDAVGDSSHKLGFELSVSPISDALAATGPSSGLPADSQAAAAMIAALLNGGLVYKATSETIAEGLKGNTEPKDLNFAMNYAKGIIALVTKNIEGGQSQNPVTAKQNTLIRLMLTSMALNLLYRARYGGMTGEEFAKLVNSSLDEEEPYIKPLGDQPEIHESIKSLVKQLVGLLKGFLPTDPAERAEMVSSLMEYVDNKNSVDSMLETTHLFKSYLNAQNLQQQKQWEALPS